MDKNLFEVLLYQNESETLDFKEDQYAFDGATDIQKSELLKDILAFANSWRREDAYILIGVREVRGGRSIVCGASSHLLNRNLQQFVNSKINRPITFSYAENEFDGHKVGVLAVPIQDRPFFLTKDYGRLKAKTV
jgi:predicted HTH transcriptional regulator